MSEPNRTQAIRFVVTVGVLSFFSDFTYEGARSIIGPFLQTLGASAFLVALITGFGEFVGYGIRLVSGRLADTSGRFWPIAIAGYLLQMSCVPLLSLAHSIAPAATLIIGERFGKAIRNPPRDVMLSHAGSNVGMGTAFGIHEALDQCGALVGPLAVAALLAAHRSYAAAFATLAIPAVINLALVFIARWIYPNPENLEAPAVSVGADRVGPSYWVYLGSVTLVAAGFADYPLIAYHFANQHLVAPDVIPVFYAVAMGVSGAGSLLCGRLYDRFGAIVLVGVTILSLGFAPLVFLGSFWPALIGVGLWGLGMGVHESLMPAIVAPLVPASQRAFAYGLFTAIYGTAWFIGSAVMGALYDRSALDATLFCVCSQIVGLPLLILVARRLSRPPQRR